MLAQSADADRVRAVELAREGQAAAAIKLFEAIVARDPADVDARLWVARLDMRLGHLDKAEAAFRAVHEAHPNDVDARIGLGAALTRKGAIREALDVLEAAERDAGANADLFGALALACRRAGDNRRAMDYYRRALAIAPDDSDVRNGYETLARSNGHGIFVEGIGQHVSPGANVGSGTFAASIRATPRLFVQGGIRMQNGAGYADAIGGGGVLWRAGRATNVTLRALGGRDNVALANTDALAEVLHYARIFEVGATTRLLRFSGTDVNAISPIFAADPGEWWRLDARYTYSRSRFANTGKSQGDHSGMARLTLREW